MENIKECPCCGSEAKLTFGSQIGDSYSEGFDSYDVRCTECNLNMAEESDTPTRAIKAWNKRI